MAAFCCTHAPLLIQKVTNNLWENHCLYLVQLSGTSSLEEEEDGGKKARGAKAGPAASLGLGMADGDRLMLAGCDGLLEGDMLPAAARWQGVRMAKGPQGRQRQQGAC